MLIFKNHLKVLKSVQGFHGYTRIKEGNSDMDTVDSVVCTVYTGGQPYKPCVLCEIGFTRQSQIITTIRVANCY